MKAKPFYIINDRVKQNALEYVKAIEPDGKLKVVVSDAGSKSSRQRGLQWCWNTDVAMSGIGGDMEDTKENVHILSKRRWAIPILYRDDEYFRLLYDGFVRIIKESPPENRRQAWIYFIQEHVHTEDFSTSQMAEFLTEFQRHYLALGVNLTDPDDRKLLEYEEAA